MNRKRWQRQASAGMAAAVFAFVVAWVSGSDPARPPEPALRALGAVHPRIAPDGKGAVFSYQGAVWHLPFESRVPRRIQPGHDYATEPCWSADGKRVAFLDGSGWGTGVLRVHELDRGLSQGVPAVAAAGKLAFAPDGTRILGPFRTGSGTLALAWVDLATGKLEVVRSEWMSYRHQFSLSADGQWIAFITTQDIPDEQSGNDGAQADLWKVAAAGGQPERIVRFPARIHDLEWLPNGQGIIVSAELGGAHNDLWRIDLSDPERPTRLTLGQADEDRPSASRDGRQLLYQDNREGCTALVLRDLMTGGERTLEIDRLDFGEPTGRLELSIVEATSRQPLVARVSIRGEGGGFHAPPGALWRSHFRHAHFYADGRCVLDLPSGRYELAAFHGPEFHPARATVEVLPGRTVAHAISLERWIDMAARGWHSGENHIHANYGYGDYFNTPESMQTMCAGEDLGICNLMVANSDGDGVFDREFFRGRPDPLSTPRTLLYWNQEFRSTIWGHMTLVNLSQLVEPIFTGFQGTTNPWDVPTNSDIADRTHWQGGLVNYTHPAASDEDPYGGPYSAKGLPVDAALGKIDSMDIMGSRDQAAAALYHRLLNCGLRLAASAGTDCFLNRIRSFLPGAERAYVQLDGPLTYGGWIDGLRAGRSFVTNGPMLELSVEGQGLGTELRLPGPASVRVRARAESPFPLTRLELLQDGKTAALGTPSARAADSGVVTLAIDQLLAVDRSGWIALRCQGPAHGDVEGPVVFAHTSPIYLVVAGRPPDSAADARFFLAWIDRLAEALRRRDRFPNPQLRDHAFDQLERARAVYLPLATPRS